MRKILFNINGGIGKNIMATGVAKAIHRTYPEDQIIVVTAWPQVWLNNEHIYRVYKQGVAPYFYEDHIRDQSIKVIASDPYMHEDFIQNKRHLIDIWCEQAGVIYKDDLPNFYFTPAERNVFARKYYRQKPIMVLQTNGGLPGSQRYMVSWIRDMPLPVAQQIANWGNENGYHVMHIRYENQPGLANTHPIWSENIRELFGVLSVSKVRILIDSFAQHACAGMELKSIVCWPIDNVTTLGYKLHNNLISTAAKKNPCLIDSSFRDYNITGELHECPFTDPVIFDAKDIIGQIEDAPKMKCLVGDCK